MHKVDTIRAAVAEYRSIRPFAGQLAFVYQLVLLLFSLVVVLFASGLLRNLPQPVLAAVVLVLWIITLILAGRLFENSARRRAAAGPFCVSPAHGQRQGRVVRRDIWPRRKARARC